MVNIEAPMSRKTTVKHQNRVIPGHSMDFETTREAWNEYALEDGSRVKLRVIPSEIVVTDEQNESGQPLVVVQAGILVQYLPRTGDSE